MSGLILKDIFNIMSQGKQILLMLAFFGVCFSGSAGSGIIIAMCTVACAAMMISSFSMDEACQWNEQAFVMPISRKKVVLSKYLVAVLCALFGIAVGLLISFVAVWARGGVFQPAVLWGASVAGIEVSLFYGAVLLPVMMRYGVNKGRFVVMGLVAVPFLIGAWLMERIPEGFFPMLDISVLLALGMVFVLLLFTLSYYISVRIMER